MSKIFINYRRDDSAAYAGRLYDWLANHFGRDYVFMDINQIAPGEDFIEVIQEKLRTVQIAIVMIGKHWLDITDDAGQRRLDNPDDLVRLEIAALLERKIRVIPVLVGGAIVPKLSQLPEVLVPLIRHNAYEISDSRFHLDVDELIQALEKIIGVQILPQPTESPKIPDPQMSIPTLQGNFSFVFGTIGTLLAVIGLFGYFSWTAKDTPANLAQPAVFRSDVFPTKQPVAEQFSEVKPLLTNQSEIGQPSKTRLPFEPEMVRIPSGKFIMGSPETELGRWSAAEGPQHEVTIDYAFEISKYEVTFEEYDAFAQATKRDLPDDRGWERSKRPVISVSFHDASAYVRWLSQQTSKKYRLLTEAEWEYAARAGTNTAYWWGNNIEKNNAVCKDCGSQWDGIRTAPVGSFKANTFGLFDTAGNVKEWTQDCWHNNYTNAPNDGLAWLEKDKGDCNLRVVRGGSWDYYSQVLRSANRFKLNANDTNDLVGFRIARDF